MSTVPSPKDSYSIPIPVLSPPSQSLRDCSLSIHQRSYGPRLDFHPLKLISLSSHHGYTSSPTKCMASMPVCMHSRHVSMLSSTIVSSAKDRQMSTFFTSMGV